MTNAPRTLSIDRRTLLGGFAAALVAPRYGFAATATDATGRTITAPDRVTRVYPAGPPAAVLLYTLAPDLLIGWLEPLGAAEREFLLPEVAARPQMPRLTGRGGAINLEAVNSLKPDLIVDAGTVNDSFKSLAETAQQQTGIPYALFDGRFEQIVPTYRALGELVGRAEEAEKLARYAEGTMTTVKERSAAAPSGARPRVYYARDKSGLQTGLGGSMIAEAIEFIGAPNVAAELHGAHGTVTLEQVRAWNPEIIIAQRSGVLPRMCAATPAGPRSPRSRPARDLCLAAAAVRLGRFSAGRQPPDRAVVARQDFLSRALSRGHQDTGPRFLHFVLSCDPDRGADRARARRQRLIAPASGAAVAIPPTLGVVLAGGRARRMGFADKTRIPIGGSTILEPRHRPARSAMPAPHPQCERRSCALRRHQARGRRRQRAGLRGPARRHSCRPRLGGWARARHRLDGERARRRPFPAARSCSATAWGAKRGRRGARLRAFKAQAAPGGWLVAGKPARGSAARADARGHAQGRRMEQPLRTSASPSGRAIRSIRSSMSTRRPKPPKPNVSAARYPDI